MEYVKITDNLEEAVKFYSSYYNYSKGFDFIKKCIKSEISDYSKGAVLVYGDHQYCISLNKMENLNRILEKYQPWNKTFIDFENIYSKISVKLYPFKGWVTLYDISFRLGIGINVFPDKKVYMTSKTVIQNAKKILGLTKKIGLTILKTDFPLALQKLESWQIEDFLCRIDIEITSKGLIFKFKNRDSKPFSKYPADVMKEIKPIWEQVYNQ